MFLPTVWVNSAWICLCLAIYISSVPITFSSRSYRAEVPQLLVQLYFHLPAMTNPMYIQYLSEVIIPLIQQSVEVRIATRDFAMVKSVARS
jgi:hypothetical protein